MGTYGPRIVAGIVAVGLTVAVLHFLQSIPAPGSGKAGLVYAHINYPTPDHCPGHWEPGHCYIP
jgi:hypothetical protein